MNFPLGICVVFINHVSCGSSHLRCFAFIEEHRELWEVVCSGIHGDRHLCFKWHFTNLPFLLCRNQWDIMHWNEVTIRSLKGKTSFFLPDMMQPQLDSRNDKICTINTFGLIIILSYSCNKSIELHKHFLTVLMKMSKNTQSVGDPYEDVLLWKGTGSADLLTLALIPQEAEVTL